MLTSSFRFQLRKNPLLCSAALVSLIGLSGCSNAQQETRRPATPSAELQARIDALKAKTLKDLVFVEGGSFMMGDFGELHHPDKLPYAGKPDALPPHKVTLDNYSIGAYKVTYADYDIYTDAVGKPRASMGEMDDFRRPTVPAGASWQEARDYCQWIGRQLNVPMDLPTEAQWEYAARSRGQMVIYATDNGKIDDGRNVASYDQRQDYAKKNNVSSKYSPMPVGALPPTSLGLYDLITDGYEWTLDWYDPDYYKSAPERNPQGPTQGTKKVQRGYSGAGGGSLGHLSFTFSRRSEVPNPPVEYEDSNPNDSNTIRCAANHPKPVRP